MALLICKLQTFFCVSSLQMIFTSCSVSSRRPPCLSDTRIVFFLNRHFCSYLYKDKKIGYDFCLTFIFCNYITSYLLLCSKKKKKKRKSWFAVDTLPFLSPLLLRFYVIAGKQKWGVFFFFYPLPVFSNAVYQLYKERAGQKTWRCALLTYVHYLFFSPLTNVQKFTKNVDKNSTSEQSCGGLDSVLF